MSSLTYNGHATTTSVQHESSFVLIYQWGRYMRSQACVPCAKRKVRCDREEPCSNCQKKQQGCVYPDDHSNERIKQLEALVRRLGGDPEHPDGAIETQSRTKPLQPFQHGNDSMIVQEQNATLYLETPIWRAWSGRYFGPMSSFKSKGVSADLVALPKGSHVWQSMFVQQDVLFQEKHPSPQDAAFLWSKYFQRVHPTLKIFFEWEITDIRSNCIAGTTLENQQYAFVFALYTLTVQSLPEAECSLLIRNKSTLLAEYQYLCEQALLASNFLTAYDIMTVRTLVLYLYSLFSQSKVNGLWDVMGIVLRKAERIGLHRDGSLLQLSPFETEIRRRIWWNIQSLDLGCSAIGGATSMSLIADWDTQLPLNIEDNDIFPQMQEMPKERPGLTSMSQCHWWYWVLQEQRNFRGPDGKRLGCSWIVNRSLSLDSRRSLIDTLENELNERYLKFCDPIKSLDMAVLTTARTWINFQRRAILLPGPAFKDARNFTKDDQQALLASSMQMLEYYQVISTSQHIFQWYLQAFFPWNAFIHVLVELRLKEDYAQANALWNLVSKMYLSTPEFKSMDGDRRKTYAAELTVEAYTYLQTLQHTTGFVGEEKPAFVIALDEYLGPILPGHQCQKGKKRRRDSAASGSLRTSEGASDLSTPRNGDLEPFSGVPMQFEDIDWLFWSLPTDDQQFFAGFEELKNVDGGEL